MQICYQHREGRDLNVKMLNISKYFGWSIYVMGKISTRKIPVDDDISIMNVLVLN